MPKYNGDANELINGDGKIRKRVCSSSSTPSVLKNYRIKRAILVPKKGGATTPVPMWKTNPKSPCSAAGVSEVSHCQSSRQSCVGPRASVSARKLATALWELNEFPSPRMLEDLEERKLMKEKIKRNRTRFYKHGSLPQHLSDPSHSPASRSSGSSKFSNQGPILPLVCRKFGGKEGKIMTSDSVNKYSLMEMKAHSQCATSRSSLPGTKSCWKDLKNNLTTSKELLKILIRSWSPGQQHASTVALASALCSQVDEARLQLDHLIQEQRLENREINCLKKKFLEEKDSWRSKERERIKTIVQSIMEELETEKRLRRRAERLNKKLGMELAQTRTALFKTTNELESERRTREIIERVYDEMVRNISQEKADAEELKRESFMVKEELEKEREMLQLVNDWREERVHMKLSEAKLQFEEKNAAVDQLRNELETFLAAKRTELDSGLADMMDGEEERGHLDTENIVASATTIIQRDEGQEGGDETDSEDSDLHSIELNINDNNVGYNWSHSSAAIEVEDEVVLNEEKHERASACNVLDANKMPSAENMIEDIKGKVNKDYEENFEHLNRELAEEESPYDKNLLEYKVWRSEESMKSSSANGTRDQVLSGSKIALPCGLPTPKKRWNRQALQNADAQLCEGSKVAEMLKVIRNSESKSRLVRNRDEVHALL